MHPIPLVIPTYCSMVLNNRQFHKDALQKIRLRFRPIMSKQALYILKGISLSILNKILSAGMVPKAKQHPCSFYMQLKTFHLTNTTAP